MRRKNFEQIEVAETDRAEVVPQAVVAAAPNQPRVAPFDLIGSERDLAIHIMEVILVGGRKRRGISSNALSFVRNGGRVIARTSREEKCRQEDARKDNRSVHLVPSAPTRKR